MEPLLTAEEVSRILRIKISTVYDWVYTGILPAVRARKGRRRSVVRFLQSDIQEFIRTNSTPVKGNSLDATLDGRTTR